MSAGVDQVQGAARERVTGPAQAETSGRPVIALMGPTAAGKTALACALADRLPVDLISVDSALIYRGMDIGTGKPTPAELARWPHQLIDICDPAESYSAARFVADAEAAIAASHARGRVPLLVGGTMLYFRALQEGLAELPSSDPAVRAALQAEAERDGLPALHARLAQIDPVSAQRIHPNDPQRLLRALEVHALSGRSLTDWWNAAQAQRPAHAWTQIVIRPPDRAVLHTQIARRFDAMLGAGLVDEVAALKTRADLHVDLPSIRCVGYRQVWGYLEGEYDHAGMRERAIAATRQLAKRQLTWLREWPADVQLPDAGEDSLQRALKALGTVPM